MITQTPWVERKFDFNFPVGMFPNIIERLKGTVSRMAYLPIHFSDEQLSTKQNGLWSVKEQVGHLYDLEELWYGRMEDFLDGKEMLRAADITNARTTAAGHNSASITTLTEQFAAARNKLIYKVAHIDESIATITSLHPRLKVPMRLIDALFFVAEHDDHHLTKIREITVSLKQ